MPRSTRALRASTLAVALAAAVGLAGCSSSSSAIRPEPSSEVDATQLGEAIIAATEDVDSYHQELVANYPTGDGEELEMAVSMDVDRSDAEQIRSHTVMTMMEQPMTLVGVGETHFVEIAPDQWMRFNSLETLTGAGFVPPDVNTPQTLANSLDTATYEGTDELDGAQVHHYVAIADPNNDEPAPPQEMPKETYDIWLDEENRLVKFDGIVGVAEGSISSTFSKFDEPVEVTEPDPATVTEAG